MKQLADSEGIEVDFPGGRLQRLSHSFVGPLAEAALQRMSFDRGFLGADAVTAEDGICEADPGQVQFRDRDTCGGHDDDPWRRCFRRPRP